MPLSTITFKVTSGSPPILPVHVMPPNRAVRDSPSKYSQKVPAVLAPNVKVSCVHSGFPEHWGLNPIRYEKVKNALGDKHHCPIYAVNILFEVNSDTTLRHEVFVVAADLGKQRYQCIIGRDILDDMIMIYNGVEKSCSLIVGC